MAMHHDWWQCLRCGTGRRIDIDDYNYELSCETCGKSMRLVSRMQDDDTLDMLRAFTNVLKAIPERT